MGEISGRVSGDTPFRCSAEVSGYLNTPTAGVPHFSPLLREVGFSTELGVDYLICTSLLVDAAGIAGAECCGARHESKIET